MKIKIIFLVFIAVSIRLIGQDSTIYIVSGKIIDGETLKPIPMVLLLNVSKYYANSTDTSGSYRLLMTTSDTIRISCIGYHTLYWQPDFSQSKRETISTTIYLTPRTYTIGNVDIYRSRWEAFVYEIISTKSPEDKTQKKLIKWFAELIDNEDLEKINVKYGISIPLPIHTSVEKQQKILREQQKIDELNKLADQKFNKEIVSRATNLEGVQLEQFMKKCNFKRDFILKTSEYELILIIQEMYKEYTLNQEK